MAEYNEVIKQFKRMCWYYSRDKAQKSCPMCTSYPNCNIGQCRKIAFEKPAYFEDVVMSWAAEHPEPVYPTWLEWLKSMGVIPYMMSMVVGRDDEGNFIHGHVDIKENALKPIPADIAEKLGLKPKENE